MTTLETLIFIGGILHLGTLIGSAQVPRELKFHDELPKVPPLLRQWILVAGGYVVLDLIAFSLISLLCARELASGNSLLARAFCAFVAIFWLCRLLIGFFVFDARPYLRNWFLTLGYHGLTLVFTYHVLIYGTAALQPFHSTPNGKQSPLMLTSAIRGSIGSPPNSLPRSAPTPILSSAAMLARDGHWHEALSGRERVRGQGEVHEQRSEVVAIPEWVQIGISPVIVERLVRPGGRSSQRRHRPITISTPVNSRERTGALGVGRDSQRQTAGQVVIVSRPGLLKRFHDRLGLVEQRERLVPSSNLAVQPAEPLVADAEGLLVPTHLGLVSDQFLDHFALARESGWSRQFGPSCARVPRSS